jgi:lipopolysaccharide export system protein LptA
LFIILALVMVVSVSAQNSNKNSKRIGTVDLYGWETMQISGDFRTMTVSGGSPELKTTDGRFYAKANKMIVTLVKTPKGQKRPAGRSAIESAELTGNVVFSAKPEENRWIKGAGAKLTVDGADETAVLDGGGKVIQVEAMDPASMDEPTVLNGEKININLKPNLGPEEWRIKALSSSTKSRLSVTPKPKSESK